MRVVVVGGGMAASRLAEQLVGADVHLTVLADEPHAPYNRILLSAVLEGTHSADALALRSPAWFEAKGYSTSDSVPACWRSTARHARSCSSTGNGWPTTVSSSRPERSPLSRRSAAWSVATAPSTRRPIRSGASRTAVSSTPR